MNRMKQLFALLLALTMVFTLTACGSKEKKAYDEAMALFEDGEYEDAADKFEELGDYEDSEDMAELCQIKADPLKAVVEFIKENGTEPEEGKYHLERDTDSEYLTMAFNYNEEKGVLTVVATSEQKFGTVTSKRMTGLDVTGDNPGTIIQMNSISSGSTNAYSAATGKVDIAALKSDTKPEFEDFYSNLGSSSKITDEFIGTSVDGINCIMEELTALLKEIHSDLTLKDLGIKNFKLDQDRESNYRDGVS